MNCFGLKQGAIIITKTIWWWNSRTIFVNLAFIYLEQLRISLFEGSTQFSKRPKKKLKTLILADFSLYLANQMMFMNGFFLNMNQCYYNGK